MSLHRPTGAGYIIGCLFFVVIRRKSTTKFAGVQILVES